MKSLVELAGKCYLKNNICKKCLINGINRYIESIYILCGNPSCHGVVLDFLEMYPHDKLPYIFFNIWRYNCKEWEVCHPFIREIAISFPECLYDEKSKLEIFLSMGLTDIVLSTYKEVEKKIISLYFYLESENTFMSYDDNYEYEQSYVELSVLHRCLSRYGELYKIDELIEGYPYSLHLPWEENEEIILASSCKLPKERGIEIHKFHYENDYFSISEEIII